MKGESSLIPTMKILNKGRRFFLRRDDIEAAMRDDEPMPCKTRKATPEECALYGIDPAVLNKPKRKGA